MAKPETVRVTFDLTGDRRILRPRYVQGQELPNWEKGPDMATYIRTMKLQGYGNFSKGPDHIYIFRRTHLS
jgi:hypothetical protein